MSVTLKKITVRQIVIIGLMAALCLVSNYFSFPVPIGIDKSRIHLGNVFCILSAFMLGPVGGGLAAGIGAFFYDIFTGYGAECIITFINKFLMAFVCGWLLNLMTRAKELLRATDLPVSEVAYRVGMENTSYFISVFRAREGATPQQYRRRWSPVA